MSDERKNLLVGTRDWSGSWGNTWAWSADGTHDGFAVMSRRDAWSGLYKLVRLAEGVTYTFSASVKMHAGGKGSIYLSGGNTINDTTLANQEFDHNHFKEFTCTGEWQTVSLTFTPLASKSVKARVESYDSSGISVCAYMLVEGTQPAAWAPAEGEQLAGGGALMSANLLDGLTPKLTNGTSAESDGTWHNAGRTNANGHDDWLIWDLPNQAALATNQTYHVGLSVRGASANDTSLHATIGYKDAAGSINYVTSSGLAIGTSWGRVEGTLVVPSGMRPFALYVAAYGVCPEMWMAAPVLSLGSPVCLASSAHTPYATQDHVAAEYATKASLKVTDDRVTAEVTERGKLAGRVGTLESTSGTHSSKLEQLAASIKSLVKGESTYTDPDGRSATSGIYSLVTQTRDSVTALFGQYTKTADLASTQAVKDAKKAGTDAQAAASAAQSTADTAKANAATAQSTANAAKGTADGLATLIRADSTGITVGKSADGQTWSTGRTHMDEDSFDVLDKAGKVLSSFGASLVRLGTNAAAILLAGILRVEALQTHPATAGRSEQTIDTGRISVPVHAEAGTPWSAIELAGRNDVSGATTTALRAEFSVDNRDGSIQPCVYVDCDMTVDGTLAMADKVSTLATRKGLRITQGSKVCHGHGTPWVTLFETWDEFKQATGCYDSSTPTLVTMNGDWNAFDGTLSGCEIRGGYPVYVLAQTTGGLPNISSSQSLRINWICIW